MLERFCECVCTRVRGSERAAECHCPSQVVQLHLYRQPFAFLHMSRKKKNKKKKETHSLTKNYLSMHANAVYLNIFITFLGQIFMINVSDAFIGSDIGHIVVPQPKFTVASHVLEFTTQISALSTKKKRN